MSYFTLGHKLPRFLSVPLFGDRDKYGDVTQRDEAVWEEWHKVYFDYYYAVQRKSVGKYVNEAGYRIMRSVNLSGKTVMEMGPGEVNHIPFWNGNPQDYTIVDVRDEVLDIARRRLDLVNVPYRSVILQEECRDSALPFEDGEFDVVVSFYSLEHMFPLESYLDELMRVLKKGGLLVGAIPAEGGLAWGLGRFLTSRRWIKKNSNVNPDQIICWEHVNFADQIMRQLDKVARKKRIDFWPFFLPIVDVNLVVRFMYERV